MLLVLLFGSAFCANGLNVKNSLLLVPYPSDVQFTQNSYRNTVIYPSATQPTKITVSPNCVDACEKFVTQTLNTYVFDNVANLSRLERFRVSLYPEIDIDNYAVADVDPLVELTVTFTGAEVIPKLTLEINESYSFSVNAGMIEMIADNIYGFRHACETLYQLLEPSGDFVRITRTPLSISDNPRFKYRGLLIDTARAYIKYTTIPKIIDLMGTLKLNVLHLHLTDSQTFTLDVPSYPLFSQKGTYNSDQIFTSARVQEIVEYARNKGVIVIPEVDMPAHSGSWGIGYPELTVKCWDYIREGGAVGFEENVLGVNPAEPALYPAIDAIIQHAATVFDGQYMHVGGDEVHLDCYKTSPEASRIQAWMNDNNITAWEDMEKYLNKYAQQRTTASGMRPIVWDEVFTNGVAAPDAIIQLWTDPARLAKITAAGLNVIYSAGWYVDMMMPTCWDSVPGSCGRDKIHWMYSYTNRDFYANDPMKDLPADQQALVLGGEGCSFGETVTEENLFNRVFQRLAAIAERLWSPATLTDPDNHDVRAMAHRCAVIRRGLEGFGPLNHQYCEVH